MNGTAVRATGIVTEGSDSNLRHAVVVEIAQCRDGVAQQVTVGE